MYIFHKTGPRTGSLGYVTSWTTSYWHARWAASHWGCSIQSRRMLAPRCQVTHLIPPSTHFSSTFLAQAEVFIAFRLGITNCKWSPCMLSGTLKLLFNVSLLNLLSISNKTLKIHYFSIPAKEFLMRLITREEERIFHKISLITHLTFSNFKYHLLDLMLFEKCLWIFIVFQGCEIKHTLDLPKINLPIFVTCLIELYSFHESWRLGNYLIFRKHIIKLSKSEIKEKSSALTPLVLLTEKDCFKMAW